MKILKQRINHSRKQKGVTLVELMIAITIGSIIMIGISSVYTSSKRSYKLQEEFSRLQENGRFAINHITRFVRSAGYSGCASGLGAISSIMNPTNDGVWNFATGIEGYDYVGSEPGQLITLPDAPATDGDHTHWVADTTPITLPNPGGANDLLGHTYSPIANTDILVSRTADGSGIEVSEHEPTATAASLKITCPVGTIERTCPLGGMSNCTLCEEDPVLVSNCQQGTAFQITNITGSGSPPPGMIEVNVTHSNAAVTTGPGNSTNQLAMALTKGDEVMRVSTKVFYVGLGTTGPSLFMKQAGNDGIELVEGVESMQVLYGEDTDATPDNIPNRYVAATDVIDFANVVAVRVSILLRSVNELPWRTASQKIYHLGGMDDDTAVRLRSPNDKRLRKVMTTTIKVRNRAFSL